MGKGIALILALFGLDALSKRWALERLGASGQPIFKNFLGIDFSLDLAFNTGIAWGSFTGYPGFWFALRALVILGLIYYTVRIHRKKPKEAFCLSLILAGAIGNALDYLLYGKVVDFFHFTFWGWSFPIFNFADSAITLGVLCLLLLRDVPSIKMAKDRPPK